MTNTTTRPWTGPIPSVSPAPRTTPPPLPSSSRDGSPNLSPKQGVMIFGALLAGVFAVTLLLGKLLFGEVEIALWAWANLPLIILFATPCAAIGYFIGRWKGRIFDAVMLSFVFGIIGCIIAACLKSTKPPKPRCPECLSKIHEGARRCHLCGSVVWIAPQPGGCRTSPWSQELR